MAALPDQLPEVGTALARLEASVEHLGELVAALQRVERGAAGQAAASVGTLATAKSTRSETRMRGSSLPRYRELVTDKPKPGEAGVYGRAAPDIKQWRQARARREQAVTGPERLRADEPL